MLLALDLGTTSTRALVVEPGGDIRSRAVRAIDTRFPAPGRVEQDPQQQASAGDGRNLRQLGLASRRVGLQRVEQAQVRG